MSNRHLVTVITPTWKRAELLPKCIETVQRQTYPNIEHLIISDGPDPKVKEAILSYDVKLDVPYDAHRTYRLIELGFNTTSYFWNSFGIAPLMEGMLHAKGNYQIWLSDDDLMMPTYIEELVDLLESEDYDFVYSKFMFYWNGRHPDMGAILGTDPPQLGQITNFLYNKRVLARPNGMPKFGTHPVDWSLVSQWMTQPNCRWAMLDKLLFYHRADQTS